jgi:hypothetical protein
MRDDCAAPSTIYAPEGFEVTLAQIGQDSLRERYIYAL